ncbi:RING finger protein 10 [Nymphon striatum]|nr:RING finger protein 10 [Nymphon striatum]
MDKNKNYHPVSKSVSNDKSKDATKCNRNGRGRGTLPNRQEFYQNKKTSPSKFSHKGFDRRLKARTWNSFPNDRNSSQELNNEAEIGSVQNPGSKKGGSNASHLLNFTFSSHTDFHAKNEYSWRVGRRKHFNKEQFLQANLKFIVKSCGDYTVHQADPDVLVDWSLVEEVQLPCNEEPKCPICLDYPSATKMTHCGHFYCWPCMLHYLALSDKSYRKCPICDEAVRKNDLKSVIFLLKRAYSVDDEITMNLMYKERGTVQAIPVCNKQLYMNGLPSFNEDNEDLPFMKFFIASAEQVVNFILRREEDDLKKLLREDSDSPESCFILEALELLNCRREDNLKSIFNHKSNEESHKRQFSGDSSFEEFLVNIPTQSPASNHVNTLFNLY